MGNSDIQWKYITDNLDRAISERWIRAYYMPIIRSSNGRVCEEEALARWIDPVRGMMSPAEFIPVLEEAKLLYKLDLHIVDEVLRKMKDQMNAGLYLVPISVNISRTDFDCCDIVEEICKRVDAAGIPRKKLIIEITENVLVSDIDYMKVQIGRFQDLGFSVWMDDFGSGYSSLDVLQEINFDHIKFDISFMLNFSREKTRIMLTELMRMAMALDLKTITEGVETEEQAEFLREIGCNKLQGYFYCKPISLEELLKRYEDGKQIGFENPEESAYYDSVGKINLYDLSIISRDYEFEGGSGDIFRKYFNTSPISVYECDDTGYRIVRCNKSYRNFTELYFEPVHIGQKFDYTRFASGPGSVYSNAIKEAASKSDRVFFQDDLPDGTFMRAVVRRVAVNEVMHKCACVLVILEIVEKTANAGLDFAQVARALTGDYIDMYYVNTDTDHFVQYSSNPVTSSLEIAHEDDDFFTKSSSDAMKYLYVEDRERFVEMFTKENILKNLEEHNKFSITYRLNRDPEPVYVTMKAMRMSPDSIIIGVFDVDAQMKRQKEYDRIMEAKITYSRIMALVGDFICIYSVDPVTDEYREFTASDDRLDSMNFYREGDDFFTDTQELSTKVIYPEDLDMFRLMFTKKKMLEEIEKNGAFNMIYRLLIGEKYEYVNLRASMSQETGGDKIIVGVTLYR